MAAGDTPRIDGIETDLNFETGTFTPTLNASTGNPTVGYNIQSGVYTRMGNIVHCVVHLNMSSVSGGSGQAEIGSLPFTSSASQLQSAFPYRGNPVSTTGAGLQHYIRPNPASTTLALEFKDNSVNSTSAVSIGTINLSQDLVASFWYFI